MSRRLTVSFLFALAVGCGLPTGDLIVYGADAPELANASVSPEGIWESVPWSAPDAP